MLALASLAMATLVFHVDASEYQHAVYNITCLAQQMPCTQEKYDQLWKRDLNWSAEDQRQLDRWRQIVRAAELRAPTEPVAPLLANYLSFFPAINERQAILAAAFDANSPASFERRVASMVPQGEARELGDVVRHFQTRLHPWWQRVGRQRVAGIRAIDRGLSPATRALLTEVAAFVHADAGLRNVYMHVVPSPDVENDDASGTVVRNHFFMELVPPDPAKRDREDPAEMVISVAIHELTHALYGSAPLAKHLEVMGQFIASPERASPSMYAFLNEAIATAVQDLAAAISHPNDVASDASGYRHPYIPRLGRAATGPLKDALATGSSITDGFIEQYLRAGRHELGGDADSLGFAFSAAALVAGDSMRSAVPAFQSVVGSTYTVGSVPEWQRAGELSAVLMLDYSDVRQFADRIPDLTSLMTHRGFAFMSAYKTRSHVLILAGRDAAALSDMIARLAPASPVPKTGVVLTVD